MRLRTIVILSVFVAFWLVGGMTSMAKGKEFVVVIDAGHGGRDPGAVGRVAQEKNINLNVALALGNLISANCPDVKVLYTRKSDVFVSLERRARIANNANADLFISIHTNALPKGKIARGAETYTLGMARADDNLEVAKRENSVILVEENYEERYAGFNPNSAESYIIFELMQDKYMEQSVSFAKMIQGEFKTTAKRLDKGVHQAGFLVLRATSMPSVLVELGYISTPDEEKYLNSKAGVAALSKSLYNAFGAYKERQTDVKDASQLVLREEQPKQASAKKNMVREEAVQVPVFKVQILTSDKKMAVKSPKLKGVEADCYQEGGLYKYTYGETTDYNKIVKIRKEIGVKFKDAFIVAFCNGQKMNVQEAITLFKKNK